ncbi:IS3 family transposase [Edaphobacter aggregans]|uniref:IS3 family transposase n=1 Tax=Edaphobacter aggregans TaxID=570835 RepID=UPI00068B89BE|nr:IS3 family transposase [Edaphobacter aggregans]
MERSSYRYEPKPDRNAELRDELVKLARQKPRYGYRRLHALLSRRGHEVNVKRIYRLYVEERMMVRRKRRKRLVRERAAESRLTRARPRPQKHLSLFFSAVPVELTKRLMQAPA